MKLDTRKRFHFDDYMSVQHDMFTCKWKLFRPVHVQDSLFACTFIASYGYYHTAVGIIEKIDLNISL